MKIEMTDREDRQGPWKFAIAGAAGSGKTMMSSTAPAPLYVFFQLEPRVKSVADRSIQHVKIVNDFTNNIYAVDQMSALVLWLQLGDHPFETLVIDTGDEFQQQMKAGRTHENGGEFGPGDWGWLGDTYREVMLGIIDLPMNVIVTYHVKNTTDEDHTFKELMLQGVAKDEAAGWFDIVGALDTYSVVDDHGQSVTKRTLVTAQTRTYPWVKDHSGVIPDRFDISPHFTDDIPRLLELASSHEEGTATEGSVRSAYEVPEVAAPEVQTTQIVPSPEDLDAKKSEAHEVPVLGGERPEGTGQFDAEQLKDPEPQPEVEAVAPIDKQDTPLPQSEPAQTAGSLVEKDDPNHTVKDEQVVPTGGPSEPVQSEEPEMVDSQASVEPVTPDAGSQPPDEAPVSDEQALAAVTETLDATEVTNVFVCTYEDPETGEKCGIDLSDDETLRDMAQIRFRQFLCRPHFKFRIDNQ